MPKSAFVSATKKVETFIYPAPLDQEDEEGRHPREDLIDDEVLKDDNGKELPQEERPWIKVRIPISAHDVDAVADLTQPAILMSANGDGSGMETRIGRMNRGLFQLLVEDWSFTERDPTVADYDKLDQWSAAWVRHCLGEANRRGTAPDFQPEGPLSSKSAKSSRAASSAGSPSE